jgi:class 3 adenylate cyclase
VAEQVEELGRVGRLKRFLAPQLAELIVSQGDEKILESHRREIVVVFCDVRGFTAFAERAEPEEVMAFLRDYHAALGPIVARFEGTLDHYRAGFLLARRAATAEEAVQRANQLLELEPESPCTLADGPSEGRAYRHPSGPADRSCQSGIGRACVAGRTEDADR